jgi:hypothetical protein
MPRDITVDWEKFESRLRSALLFQNKESNNLQTNIFPMIKKPSSWRVAPSKSAQLECFLNSMLNQTYLTLPILGKKNIWP